MSAPIAPDNLRFLHTQDTNVNRVRKNAFSSLSTSNEDSSCRFCSEFNYIQPRIHKYSIKFANNFERY